MSGIDWASQISALGSLYGVRNRLGQSNISSEGQSNVKYLSKSNVIAMSFIDRSVMMIVY